MVYFVSGHRDLTEEEFEKHYVPLIQKIIEDDPKYVFCVGDWEGCDIMFLNYIKNNYKEALKFTWVYFVDEPRLNMEEYPRLRKRKKYTYDECDASMTYESDYDIAWIRPGREDSHTANNIRRRYKL